MAIFIPKNVKKIISVSKVVNCFHTTFKPNPDFTKYKQQSGAESHNFWEFAYIEKGDAFAYEEGKYIHLHQDEVFFYTPCKNHTTVASDSYSKCHFISFESKSKVLSIFLDKVIKLDHNLLNIISKLIETSKKTFTYQNEDEDGKKVVYLKLLKDAPPGGLQVYKRYLEIFLIELMWFINQKQYLISSSKETFEQRIYDKIIDTITRSIYGTFSIKKICDEVNYSKAYVSTLFKKYSGISIYNYYNNLKINEAKKLLINNEFSISEISEMLCYSSPYYFSYAFKKETGTSPSEYIKKHSK